MINSAILCKVDLAETIKVAPYKYTWNLRVKIKY